MIKKEIIINDETGLHGSFATVFLKTANMYKSNLTLEVNGRKANGKALLGILSMGIGHNDEVLLVAEGPDELEMIEALVKINE